MSFITPISVGEFPRNTRPLGNVQPFTYRDGATYLEILESLRSWMKDYMVPFLNGELGEVNEAWTSEITEVIQSVNAALTLQASQVNAQAEQWMDTTIENNDSINETLITDELSETAKAIDAHFWRQFFQDANGLGYGNSYLYPNYGATPFVDRLPGMLGITMVNNGYSGYRMQDTANIAYALNPAMADGRAARPLPFNGSGVVVLYDLLNNLLEADTESNRNTALESLRLFVARASAGTITLNTNETFVHKGASWGAVAEPDAYNGSAIYMGTSVIAPDGVGSGSQLLSFTLPGGRIYDLVFMGGGNNYGGYKFDIDGVEHGELSAKYTNLVTPGNPRDKSYLVYTVDLTGEVGNKTLTATPWNNTGLSGTQIFWTFDSILLRSESPPIVIVNVPLVVNVPGHTKPELLQYLQTLPGIVASEFPNVIVADGRSGWNPSTMLGVDNLHPNEAGQEFLANLAAGALKDALMATLRGNAFSGSLGI